MKKYQDIAQVVKNGGSLALNVTAMCKKAQIVEGDYVIVQITKIDPALADARGNKPVGIEEARRIVRDIFLKEGEKYGLVGCEVAWYAGDVYAKIPDEETHFVLEQFLAEGLIYEGEMGQYRMNPLKPEFWKGGPSDSEEGKE